MEKSLSSRDVVTESSQVSAVVDANEENIQIRPWLGGIVEVMVLAVQWYQRNDRSLKFHAMNNADKTAHVTELENQSAMMRDISVDKTNTSFNLTHYKLSKEVLAKVRSN